MRLTNVQITNFRPVEDSGNFGIEADVTCLVGKNESGKTATLQALYRLNPIESSQTFDEDIDFPAKRTRDRRNYRPKQRIPVVKATFELTDEEAGRLEAEFGPNVLRSRSVTYTKGYRAATSGVTYDLDEQQLVAHLTGQLDPTSRSKLGHHDTVEDFSAALRGLDDRPTAVNELLEQLDNWGGTGWECVHSVLQPKLPAFVYFDDYDSMPGKVSIPDLIRKRDQNLLTRGEQALLSLLDIAGAELEDFMQNENHERLQRAIENASASISREVFTYWSQNKELAVKLTVMQPEAGAPAPLNEGPILWIRVWNDRHQASVPFDERSRGFVWFFSFLAYFTNLENGQDDLILLLDEPGLSLHARAQEDLLRLIDERLAPKHQVIYTTHSPFMVSADHFNRVRTVIDQDGSGTEVSAEIFKADEDTAFPLYGAMGIGMTQSLFIGEHTLLLEGPSDLIYLDVLSDALTEQARTGLDPRWVKTPIGGSGKLSTFATLLGANKLNVAVLIDSSTKDTGAIRRLRDNDQLSAGGLLEISDFIGTKNADIEDLFGKDFYLELVNRAYAVHLPKKLTKSSLKSKDPRLVRQIEVHFQENDIAGGKFDHYKPAARLLREAPELVPMISNDTLTAAENLFKKINELLP